MIKRIHMKGRVLLICVLFLAGAFTGYGADERQDELDKVLASAESFFRSLKSGSYGQAWSLLSVKSRETIIDDIYRGSKSSGTEYAKQQIAGDMKAGGMIAGSYWKGVLQSFDPNAVLEESRWEAGSVRSDRAQLLITHKKSKSPAQLQMFNEGGLWKVGLVESFWTMKK